MAVRNCASTASGGLACLSVGRVACVMLLLLALCSSPLSLAAEAAATPTIQLPWRPE